MRAAPSCAILLSLTWLAPGAVASRGLLLRKAQRPNAGQHLIPKTDVPMPADYEDYARSRTPLALFPGTPPGLRFHQEAPAPGLPEFYPSMSKEVFTDALPIDPTGAKCAPGGDAAGHYFYNVMTPEVVPYVLANDDPKNTGAAVVIAPGGGNIHLAWEPEGISAAEWYNTIGVSAFVLKYRVPATGELTIIDGQRAMSLVRSKAAEYGIDPTRIGLMGSSAGGSLALAVQNTKEKIYSRIDAVDDVSHMPDFLVLNYPGLNLERDAAPDNVRTMPPTAFGFAEDDPCCGSGAAHVLQAALQQYATSPSLIGDFPEGKHGWGSCDYYPQLKGMEVCTWKAQVESFLRDNHLLQSK